MVFNWVLGIVAVGQTLYLLRKGVNVGIIMLINALILAVGTRMMPLDVAMTVVNAGLSAQTIRLILALVLIMMLERTMRDSGAIERIVTSLKGLVGSNRLSAMILPATLGLLPSPGGARFSSPLVENSLDNIKDGTMKAYVNYWYRHVWIDMFPLYPAIIVLSEFMGVSPLKLFVYMLPFMAVYVLSGYLLFVRRIPLVRHQDSEGNKKQHLKQLFWALFPIIVVIGLYMAGNTLSAYTLQISLVVVLVGIGVRYRWSPKHTWKILKESLQVKYIILILGVMIFSQMLHDSGTIALLQRMVESGQLPIKVLYIVLPFVTAFLSGLAVSFVTTSFPILLPLGLAGNTWTIIAVFVVGYCGILATPLHLCVVMSSDYFKTNVAKVLRWAMLSLIPIAAIALTIIILH